jgi:hypothetical protein
MWIAAQAGGPFGGGNANQEFPPEAIACIVIFVVVALLIGLVIEIFFLLTLSRCFSQISPANRQMEPGMVWLNLIPCFSAIWIFFTTIRLADSLRAEFYQRQLRGDGDFGRTLGIAFPILQLLGAIPYIGTIFSLAGLVCWIIYWVKIAGYSRQLREDTMKPSTGPAAGEWDDDRGWQEGAYRA